MNCLLNHKTDVVFCLLCVPERIMVDETLTEFQYVKHVLTVQDR